MKLFTVTILNTLEVNSFVVAKHHYNFPESFVQIRARKERQEKIALYARAVQKEPDNFYQWDLLWELVRDGGNAEGIELTFNNVKRTFFVEDIQEKVLALKEINEKKGEIQRKYKEAIERNPKDVRGWRNLLKVFPGYNVFYELPITIDGRLKFHSRSKIQDEIKELESYLPPIESELKTCISTRDDSKKRDYCSKICFGDVSDPMSNKCYSKGTVIEKYYLSKSEDLNLGWTDAMDEDNIDLVTDDACENMCMKRPILEEPVPGESPFSTITEGLQNLDHHIKSGTLSKGLEKIDGYHYDEITKSTSINSIPASPQEVDQVESQNFEFFDDNVKSTSINSIPASPQDVDRTVSQNTLFFDDDIIAKSTSINSIPASPQEVDQVESQKTEFFDDDIIAKSTSINSTPTSPQEVDQVESQNTVIINDSCPANNSAPDSDAEASSDTLSTATGSPTPSSPSADSRSNLGSSFSKNLSGVAAPNESLLVQARPLVSSKRNETQTEDAKKSKAKQDHMNSALKDISMDSQPLKFDLIASNIEGKIDNFEVVSDSKDIKRMDVIKILLLQILNPTLKTNPPILLTQLDDELKESIKKSFEDIITKMKKSAEVTFNTLDPELKADKDFIEKALKKNPFVYEYLPLDILTQDDKYKYFSEAVKQFPILLATQSQSELISFSKLPEKLIKDCTAAAHIMLDGLKNDWAVIHYYPLAREIFLDYTNENKYLLNLENMDLRTKMKNVVIDNFSAVTIRYLKETGIIKANTKNTLNNQIFKKIRQLPKGQGLGRFFVR